MIHRKKGKTSAESVPQGRGYRGTLFFADLVPFFRNILKAILFEHKEHGKWSGSVLATSGRDAVPANGVQEVESSNLSTQTKTLEGSFFQRFFMLFFTLIFIRLKTTAIMDITIFRGITT